MARNKRTDREHRRSSDEVDRFVALIGQSPTIVELARKIPRVAETDAVVLIRGETGTGKELVARAIHYLSPRRKGPFVPENCGRLPAELFANEFFGHEPGAYTGAVGPAKGLIGCAEGGTLVLDELDSLPLPAQAIFLRFIEDRNYHRLGGQECLRANVRMVAITNQDLAANVDKGLFRRDLYHRLKVAELVLPPLRNRPGDIEILANHFLAMFAQEHKRPVRRLGRGCVDKLSSYDWPGNVRELKDVIEQAVIFSDGESLTAAQFDLPDPERGGETVRASFKTAKAMAVRNFELKYLSRTLEEAGYNVSKAARAAGMQRGAMWNLLRKHHLLADQKRSDGHRP